MRSDSKQISKAAAFLPVAGVCAATILLTRKFAGKTEKARYGLRGKVVLITGGSRGLGLAIAQELGSRGARLALCARDHAELERARTKLTQLGFEVEVFAADICQADEIRSLVERVIAHYGAIDVLVNDAGSISVGPYESFSRKDFEDAMDLMFWAPVNLSFAVLPHMREKRSGQIVNITSIGGRVSVPHLLPYCCAKHAFVGFSTGLGAELDSRGINVVTVVPGLMRTGSYMNAKFRGASQEEFAWFGLLGNLPGFSVAADYSATLIREAIEDREQTCTISLPAKVLVALEALAPDVNRAILSVINRFALPQSGSQQEATGKQLNPSLNILFQSVTALGRLAANRLNESPAQ